jgi:hypothetical protein
MTKPTRKIELATAKKALTDARSRRVAFVAHCLLNQNARYQGGASRPGALFAGIADLIPGECGVVQLPCPELPAWGGPDKPFLWLPVARSRVAKAILGLAGLPLFLLWTRASLSSQARRVAREIRAYQDRGYEVELVVGIDGSPTCGVSLTLDLRACFRYFSGLKARDVTLSCFNEGLYAACSRPGPGLFIASLMRALERKASPRRPMPEIRGWSLPRELGIAQVPVDPFRSSSS